jgi:hypothetical protein
MSGLPPIATELRTLIKVRFAPNTGNSASSCAGTYRHARVQMILFDDLVGERAIIRPMLPNEPREPPPVNNGRVLRSGVPWRVLRMRSVIRESRVGLLAKMSSKAAK